MTDERGDPQWADFFESDYHVGTVDIGAGGSIIAWLLRNQTAEWRFYALDVADDVPHMIWPRLTDEQRATCEKYEPDFFVVDSPADEIGIYDSGEWQRVCEIIAGYENMQIRWEWD